MLLAAGGPASAVALKLHRASVSPAETIGEAAMLDAVRSRHAARLFDVESTREGAPVLVLEALRGGTLADIIATRGALRPEEVVTVIAPLAELLADLHDRGVTHGALGARHIVFDAQGAPVLVGWGSARSAASAWEARAEMEDDVAALGQVTAALLAPSGESLPESGFADAAGLSDWLHQRFRAGAVTLPSDPRPLRHEGEPHQDAGSLAASSYGVTPVDTTMLSTEEPLPRSHPIERVRAGSLRTWLDLAGLPRQLVEVSARHAERSVPRDAIARARAGWAMVTSSLRTVRRGHRLAGIAGAGAIVVAVALSVGSATGAPPNGVADVDSTDALESSQSVAPAGIPAAAGADASGGDEEDPAVALRRLLAHREQCLREASFACLAAVVQQGSAAEQEDSAALTAGDTRALPLVPVPADAEIAIVDLLGDGALVTVTAPQTEPASVLLIRTEAGWRIRMMMAG